MGKYKGILVGATGAVEFSPSWSGESPAEALESIGEPGKFYGLSSGLGSFAVKAVIVGLPADEANVVFVDDIQFEHRDSNIKFPIPAGATVGYLRGWIAQSANAIGDIIEMWEDDNDAD